MEQDNGSCIFLIQDGSCLIHEVKPRQCRDFPMSWNYPGFERTCLGMTPEEPPVPRELTLRKEPS